MESTAYAIVDCEFSRSLSLSLSLSLDAVKLSAQRNETETKQLIFYRACSKCLELVGNYC